jgi:hypothetical protein
MQHNMLPLLLQQCAARIIGLTNNTYHATLPAAWLV